MSRLDLPSAYLASLTKIASWATISALIYHQQGPTAFAMFALIRSVIGLLNYVSLNLSPAMIHHLARRTPAPILVQPLPQTFTPGQSLPYMSSSLEKPPRIPATPAQETYFAGLAAVVVIALATTFALFIFSDASPHYIHFAKGFRTRAPSLLFTLGIGLIIRLTSDASGAVLQANRRIALDNLLLTIADALWLVLSICWISPETTSLLAICGAFIIASLFLFIARFVAAEWVTPIFNLPITLRSRLVLSLLSFGLLLTLSQLADYLYAPTDFLLINHFLTTKDLAAYAPVVQIDAALLLLVTGLSSFLLPKAALAHANSDIATLRRYYLQGTLLSLTLLLPASLLTWLLSPHILRLWLHDIPPGSLSILPLVLLHTTLGGSSAVGRSILIGMGKIKPLTAATLTAGAANVLLSYTFVSYFHWGLQGIVLGTIIAVTLRCALWQPWYLLHTLKSPPNVPPVNP